MYILCLNMHHDIAEILLKLALNTNQSINLYILFLADRTYSLLSNHLITVKAIKNLLAYYIPVKRIL